LGDVNSRLIGATGAVKASAERVSEFLEVHRLKHSSDHYYAERSKMNAFSGIETDPENAARFIYLNQACFNGIYRVNRSGAYNVPFGDKAAHHIPTLPCLKAVQGALKSAELRCESYAGVAGEAKSGDFIYLDPPYPPLNETAYFTHYTPDRFGLPMQAEVAAIFWKLHALGCLVMVSNADTAVIRALYKGAEMYQVPVTRCISCKKQKLQASELIITNYRIAEAEK
jgi:DNA adenine methylase